jgi:hypothetical protein
MAGEQAVAMKNKTTMQIQKSGLDGGALSWAFE